MADDLAFLSATELLKRYRDKSLSPVAVIETTLRRLETYEGALNAFVLYDPESALASARVSEARWRKGEPQGLLDGVPVAIKDTQLTRGWPLLVGSRTIDPNQNWNEDAPSTARLRAAGAVLFGKTTTPEFGWKPVTDSPLTGITRNPWNLDRTPGGRVAAARRRCSPASARSLSAPMPAARSASPRRFRGCSGTSRPLARSPSIPPRPSAMSLMPAR
jgi:aspartyl-tRNA(Asn)/glutamyl-tRNA(Gln) amidotransferase subunit A